MPFLGTHLHFRPVDGFSPWWLKRRGLAQGCAFLGLVDMAPHLRGQIPKNNFGEWILAFPSQAREIKKHAYYRNYYIDSNQILHSDKDRQMPFVGGPNTCTTNPRWRTAAVLEKLKNQHILATVWLIAMTFSSTTHIGPLRPTDR